MMYWQKVQTEIRDSSVFNSVTSFLQEYLNHVGQHIIRSIYILRVLFEIHTPDPTHFRENNTGEFSATYSLIVIANLYNYCITKTCLYNFDPLKPHFYLVKLGFTGVYIIFLISA